MFFVIEHAKIFQNKAFDDIGLVNFKPVMMSEEMIDHVLCTDEKNTEDRLDPCSNSDESFVINFDPKSNKTSLMARNIDQPFDDYCVVINDDLTYSAHVCREKKVTMSAKDK